MVYLELLQASKVKLFVNTINSLKPLTIFAKSFLTDACSGSSASDIFYADSYPSNKNVFFFILIHAVFPLPFYWSF